MRLPLDDAQLFLDLYLGLIGWCARRRDPKSSIRDAKSARAAPLEDIAAVRDWMFDNPASIEAYVAENPDGVSPETLALVDAWRSFVRGDLVVARDLKRHTIFLDWKNSPTAYGALSLTEEIVDILPMPLPMVVDAVLLPWRGAIVCDGIIGSHNLHLGAGIRRELADAYRRAKANGIVTTLPTDSKDGDSSSGATRRKHGRPPRAAKSADVRASPERAFLGRWRIVHMDAWEEDYVETDGPAYFEIEKRGLGSFGFGLVLGEIDGRFAFDGDRPVMEFSWEGRDEGEPVCGRGVARIDDNGVMRGTFFFHRADESGFRAMREG